MASVSGVRAERLEAVEAEGTYRYDMENPLIYRNAMGRYKTECQLGFILGELCSASGRVLDIGGGSGRLAIPVAQAGHAVTVLDPSADALELLAGRVGEGIATAHGDLMSFDTSAQFDAALAIDTVKYLFSSSLSDVFTKINGLLRPGGLLVIAEINRTSWRNRLSVALGRRRDYPYNIGSAREYADALRTAGFEVRTMRGFLWMPFSFNSDSGLVSVFERMERRLRLGRWVKQSPWLLIAATKV